MIASDGYSVTLRCDTCDIDRRCYLLGRDYDTAELPGDVVSALTAGWAAVHHGHDVAADVTPDHVVVTSAFALGLLPPADVGGDRP